MWASWLNFFFANIAITIVNASMFYYVMSRISNIFSISTPKRILVIIAISISLIIISTIMYHWNSKLLDILWTISSWIFVLWFLFAILLFITQIIWIRYKINPRIFSWIIIVILWLGIFFALKTKITTYNITSDKIAQDTKILLVSDIHTDHIFKSFHIKKIKKIIENQNFDFVLIAWDMMNKANQDYPNYFSILKSDNYPPIIAIAWNHDLMWDTQIVYDIPEKSSIKLLNNESIEINWIQIIWIIDKSIRWSTILEDNLNKSDIDDNPDKFWILLTHQPIWLEKLKNYPIDLEVAGHTHRGQIFGLRKFVDMVNEYWYGKYEENWKTAIITQWIGTWWLPFRLWTQSEIVIITTSFISIMICKINYNSLTRSFLILQY